MYKFNRFAYAVFCLSLVFSTNSFAKKITLACSPWYPFSGQELDNQGFYNQIVKKAAAAVDLEVKIEIMPWNRLMVLTKQGKLDGISCPSYQKEREVWLAFTKTDFFVVEAGLFARKDSQINMKGSQIIKGKDGQIKRIEAANLKGKQIGILANSFAAKVVAKYGKGNLILKEYFDENDGMKMLHVKRFDLIYLSRVTGEKLLSDRYSQISKDIEYIGTLSKVFIHPAISLKRPKAKEIAKKLDAGYQIIKENGQLAEITYRVLN